MSRPNAGPSFPSRRGPRRGVIAILFCSLFVTVATQAQDINTAAGNGIAGFSGDGGPATSASLNRPQGVAVDASGNLYVVDTDNHRIRRVATNGVITTVAGTGAAGMGGDGGPATSARLNLPRAVAVDANGNLFIADRGNNRIRKVQANGTISTIAGTGVVGFGGDGGPAVLASLGRPYGVAVDPGGNVLIADTANNRIRRVTPGGVISTVAVLEGPFRVFADAGGSLYVADSTNRIRKVAAGGAITTVAGNGIEGFSGDGGPATSARLASPDAVALDDGGNLFIVDSFNHRVRKVDPAGTISTAIGNGIAGFAGDGGPALGASLNQPLGIAIDGAGNIYVGDFGNQRIRRVGAISAAQMARELVAFIDGLAMHANYKLRLMQRFQAVALLLEAGPAQPLYASSTAMQLPRPVCAHLGNAIREVEMLAAASRIDDVQAIQIVLRAEAIGRAAGCATR